MAMNRIVLLVLAGLLVSGCGPKHVISVNRLEAMSKINVLYVVVGTTYTLRTGKSEISRLVRGGAYYAVDLSKIRVDKESAREGESIVISLPRPKVEPMPDPSRSIEFDAKTKLLVNDTGLNRMREGYDEEDRKQILAVASEKSYFEMAEKQAERILRDILPELKVEVLWLNEN